MWEPAFPTHCRDLTGKLRTCSHLRIHHYGFVTFEHDDGAIHALKEPSKKIDNRVTVTQYAAGGPGHGSVNNPLHISQRKIYVANVPQDMSAERLLAHFSVYGEIKEGPLGFDKVTGKSKGFALFIYRTSEAAKASVVDPIKNIEGYPLSCKFGYSDGKKENPGAGVVGPGGLQTGNEVRGDAVGVGMTGQFSGHGSMGGFPSYSCYPGGNPLNLASGGGAGVGSVGVGGSMGPGAANQSRGGSLGTVSGFGSVLGGGYGTGSHFGGLSSGGYAGTGTSGSSFGVQFRVSGGGIGSTGAGLSGAGNGRGVGHGSSLYGMAPIDFRV